MECRERFAAGLIGKDLHIIAILRCWPEAKYCISAHPFLANHLVKHRIGVFEQIPRRFAVSLIFEDGRITALKLPCRKERRPIDEIT